LRFGENLENCLNFSESVLFFSSFASGVRNLAECAEKGRFLDVLIKGLFCGQFRNVTSPRGGEHRIGRTYLNFALIGCKSTKKCAKMTILKIKVMIRKFKCHQKIPWVLFAGTDISNYGLILNTHSARGQIIILMKNFIFFLESAVVKIYLFR
jgi:hypothetical protein